MAIYTAGMTGAQFLAALNTQMYYNAKSYGAVGDDNTDNTTVLQALINIVAVNGGTIYIPAGTYKTRTLTLPTNVGIIGENIATVIKSTAAEPLIVTASADYKNGIPGLQNIALDGDSVGTIGWSTTRLNHFVIHNLFVTKFTTYGIKLQGTLVCSFDACTFETTVLGVYANLEGGPVSAPNLIIFKDCHFLRNTTRGVDWTRGLMVTFDSCNFGANGTSGNAATGAITYKGGSGVNSRYQIGLVIRSCWFEANHGTIINIDEPNDAGQALVSEICNSHFIVNTPVVEVKILGVTTANKLIIRSSSLQHSASLIIDGANASVINDLSEIAGSVTQSNSGKYYITDFTEVT